MSQLDFTTALTRLLSNAALRAEFKSNRDITAASLIEDTAERALLLQLSDAEIDAQADALLNKRAGQVAGFLPMTWEQLGTAAARTFREYACDSAWPQTHRRHQLDAIGFAEWLEQKNAPELVRHELRRAQFAVGDKKVSVCLVNHPSVPITARGVLILRRTTTGTRSWRIWLPLP